MFPFIRPQDIADIIIMSILVYQLYRWFKNTKALQVVIGLGFLVVIYIVTKNFGLFMTSWILQELGTVLFVLLIVIFQTEIRQALYRFSLLRKMFGRSETVMQLDLMDLATTIFSLAAERTGAIIVFQREEPLDEYLLHGVPLDSRVSSQLLGSIFQDGTPLHDGAILVRDGRIAQASCHLPLSANSDIPQYYGTRHRAGLGLTERSDAVVLIVSEERGEVSLALAGELEKVTSPEQLSERLHGLLASPASETTVISVRERLFSNLWPKLITVLLVTVSWLIITFKQGGIVSVTAPIKFHNLPENLVLLRSFPEEVDVQLKVFSSLTPSPKQLDLVADLDLKRIKEGTNNLPIKNEDFNLPPGMVVAGTSPPSVKVTVEKKVRKTLKVRLNVVGRLPGRQKIRKIKLDPEMVVVEGPEHILAQLDSLETEEVDLSKFQQSGVVERGLQLPLPQVKVVGTELIKIRMFTSSR